MTIAVASVATASVVSSTTSLTKPSGTADGDLLLMFLAEDSLLAGAVPSGFTQIGSTQTTPSGLVFSAKFKMYYRYASSEPASYTIGAGNGYYTGAMARITGGPTSGDPTDGIGTWATGSGTSAVASQVDPTTLALLVAWTVGVNNSAGGAWSFASAAAMTEQWDFEVGDVVGQTLDSQVLASDAATGSRTTTLSRDLSSGTDWGTILIAIKGDLPATSTPNNRLLLGVG